MPEKTYLRPKDAASYLALAYGTLAKMRHLGTGPGFIRAGARAILYDIDVLDAWLESMTFENTSQYVGRAQ